MRQTWHFSPANGDSRLTAASFPYETWFPKRVGSGRSRPAMVKRPPAAPAVPAAARETLPVSKDRESAPRLITGFAWRKVTNFVIIRYYDGNVKPEVKNLKNYSIETNDSRLSLFLSEFFRNSVDKLVDSPKFHPKNSENIDMAAEPEYPYGLFGDMPLTS